jgi:hypothetical protein
MIDPSKSLRITEEEYGASLIRFGINESGKISHCGLFSMGKMASIRSKIEWVLDSQILVGSVFEG